MWVWMWGCVVRFSLWQVEPHSTNKFTPVMLPPVFSLLCFCANETLAPDHLKVKILLIILTVILILQALISVTQTEICSSNFDQWLVQRCMVVIIKHY